ncbi:MAG: hypothetical protein JO222_00935 [Frankiales bacterium]|nr:hypothetical protein [Frankiales bacterium]
MTTTPVAPQVADLRLVPGSARPSATAVGTRPLNALLVAAAGGHLLEMAAWAKRFVGVASTTWVTSHNGQSRIVLADEDVRWVKPVAPRDLAAAMSLLPLAREMLARENVDIVVSTGSAIAVPFLAAARMRGIEACYIESATRTSEPSLTGRLLRAVPGVRFFTQAEAWAGKRWSYAGSVFDGYEAEVVGTPRVPLHVVVALGSMRFPMTRLVDNVIASLPADASVTWQLGHTPVPAGAADLAGHRFETFVSHDELADAMRRAHVVISHAGVGTALTALGAGRFPILVPRQARHREHVDDHQEQMARDLDQRGLAFGCASGEITTDVLLAAASRAVHRRPTVDGLTLLPRAQV